MDQTSFYITGIGASAGGTAALKTFFQNIDDEPETAFIIIQHLATHQKGFTKDWLKNSTSLPIIEVKNRTEIKKNHIYLIPPQDFLLIEDRDLVLKPRDPAKKVNDAIDVFFRSLGEQAGDKAIGIVLSGLGSDGAKGAQMIKEKGGIIMVQSPETAAFSSMPLEAIMSDNPDIIDSPDKIAQDLMHFTKQPPILSVDSDGFEKNEGEAVQKIISLVNEFSGVDFRNYKINSIVRRINKRQKINHLNSAAKYFRYLGENPDEIRVLFNDLLIGVTEFFRDKEAFDFLKEKVIPVLCQKEIGFNMVRIWVAGCSTGEEAYTIAILMEEHIKNNNLHVDFRIFATDLDQKAIEIARRGRYSKQIELQVPERLLNSYFIPKGEFYEISNETRKKINFSMHNLLNDPPFIRIDLITCRNFFIYLKEEVQKKLLYTFNYALNEDGFLMLGIHETNSDFSDMFEEISSVYKIFKNKKNAASIRHELMRNPTFSYRRFKDIALPPPRPKPMEIDQHQEFFAELLLEKYAPDCMLLTEDNQVVYSTGKVDEYLHYPKRKLNLHLFEMVRGSTSLALRNGLRKVKEVQRNVVLRKVNFTKKNGETNVVDLFFYSIFSSSTSQRYVLVEIKPVDKGEDDQEFTDVSSRESLREIERLEAELKQAKRELQYNADELETINEELQSSNEEMKSSNEVMQTANEELQSSNEELKAVNVQLRAKIDEISLLHDDVNNLFISSQIATLFLDRNLRIRKFTPAVKSYFNIRETDIGRPFIHYTYNFDYPDLEKDVAKVLQNMQPLQKEIKSGKKGYVLIKIHPYKTNDMRIEGVVLTLLDISELMEANLKLKQMAETLQKRTQELEQSEKYWRSLVENTPDIVAIIDHNATIKFVNQAIISHLGIPPGQLTGKKLLTLRHLYGVEEIKQLNQQVQLALKNKKILNFYQDFTSEKAKKNYYITLIPEYNDQQGTILIARDFTPQRSVERRFEEKNRILETVNQYMDNFVHAVAHDLRSPLTNLKLILDLLSDEENMDKREMLVGKLNSAVMRIDEILNGLIEIIDSQVNISEKVSSIKFRSVVKKVLKHHNEELPENARINYEFEVEEIFHLKGYIFSIIRNLLSNSIKYRKKDMPLIIHIGSRKIGEYILLSIEDNGIGMDFDNMKDNLFKPFKRFTSGDDGLGIGLHIVKSMVEKSGGKVEVESEVGKGTKFLIYLKDKYSEHITDR